MVLPISTILNIIIVVCVIAIAILVVICIIKMWPKNKSSEEIISSQKEAFLGLNKLGESSSRLSYVNDWFKTLTGVH